MQNIESPTSNFVNKNSLQKSPSVNNVYKVLECTIAFQIRIRQSRCWLVNLQNQLVNSLAQNCRI